MVCQNNFLNYVNVVPASSTQTKKACKQNNNKQQKLTMNAMI